MLAGAESPLAGGRRSEVSEVSEVTAQPAGSDPCMYLRGQSTEHVRQKGCLATFLVSYKKQLDNLAVHDALLSSCCGPVGRGVGHGQMGGGPFDSVCQPSAGQRHVLRPNAPESEVDTWVPTYLGR